MSNRVSSFLLRAERRAAPKPARTLAGGRSMYSSGGGLS